MKRFSITKLILPVVALGLIPAVSGFAEGSLWNKGGATRSMYADRRAAATGDILTIIVQESSQTASSQRTETSKSSSVEAQINQLLGLLEADDQWPRLGWQSNRNFEGGGQIANTQSAQSRVSVVVTDRLPNGNLVVEGVRRVSFSGEENYVVLTGLVRAADVSASNTVFSSQVADAQIEFVSAGTLTNAQREGWLNRLHGFLNPF